MTAIRTTALTALATLLCCGFLPAQTTLGAAGGNQPTHFKDTSMFHPPTDAKVAVLEWEDLECPYCARAFPSVHIAVAHTGAALVERDFLIPGHVWSPVAALVARYLHDKVSPALATEYRREVFASQFRINSREDLQHFTEEFLRKNGKTLPANADPTGALQKEIDADVALGNQAGIVQTPTIIVVSAHHWTQVLNIDDLDQAIHDEEARAASATKHTAAKRATAAKR